MVTSPTPTNLNTEEPHPLRDGAMRYWGYINEIAEAFAPQVQSVLGKQWLGKDVVSYWSYRLVDVYAGLDGLYSGIHEWQKNKDEQNDVKRFGSALTSGLGAWLFQQMASVYLPATLVSGVRKGSDSALNRTPLHTLFGKKGLDAVLGGLELTISLLSKQFIRSLQRVPGLRKALAHPQVKKWLPSILAAGLIPFIIKPIDKFSHAVVNHTVIPLSHALGKVFVPLLSGNRLSDNKALANHNLAAQAPLEPDKTTTLEVATSPVQTAGQHTLNLAQDVFGSFHQP
jgi:hypothetical protein